MGMKFIAHPIPFGERFDRTVEYLWKVEGAIVDALVNLLRHPGQSAGEMVGPVGMVTTTVTAAKGGADVFFFILAAVTVNLGIMNLLPIPALDGGQALFAAYKAVTGEEAPHVVRRLLISGSFLLLFGLLIVLTVKDLVGAFRG
jgi:regulator of sigma E protease